MKIRIPWMLRRMQAADADPAIAGYTPEITLNISIANPLSNTKQEILNAVNRAYKILIHIDDLHILSPHGTELTDADISTLNNDSVVQVDDPIMAGLASPTQHLYIDVGYNNGGERILRRFVLPQNTTVNDLKQQVAQAFAIDWAEHDLQWNQTNLDNGDQRLTEAKTQRAVGHNHIMVQRRIIQVAPTAVAPAPTPSAITVAPTSSATTNITTTTSGTTTDTTPSTLTAVAPAPTPSAITVAPISSATTNITTITTAVTTTTNSGTTTDTTPSTLNDADDTQSTPPTKSSWEKLKEDWAEYLDEHSKYVIILNLAGTITTAAGTGLAISGASITLNSAAPAVIAHLGSFTISHASLLTLAGTTLTAIGLGLLSARFIKADDQLLTPWEIRLGQFFSALVFAGSVGYGASHTIAHQGLLMVGLNATQAFALQIAGSFVIGTLGGALGGFLASKWKQYNDQTPGIDLFPLKPPTHHGSVALVTGITTGVEAALATTAMIIVPPALGMAGVEAIAMQCTLAIASSLIAFLGASYCTSSNLYSL